MPDHLTRVREQANKFNELLPDGSFADGAAWLASRLTREKIAITLAKKTTSRWDELPGDMHLALIHSKYGEADAILALVVEGEK